MPGGVVDITGPIKCPGDHDVHRRRQTISGVGSYRPLFHVR